MAPRWRLLITYALVSTVMLLVSPVFGPLGWAVPLVVLNPVLTLLLSWRDTAQRGFTWLWFLIPTLTGVVQALILMNASAIPFSTLLLIGAALGVGLGAISRRRTMAVKKR